MFLINLKNNKHLIAEQHPFHLVNPSPWPLFIAFFLLSTIFYLIGLLHDDYLHPCLFFQHIYLFSFLIFFISVIL